MSKLLASFGFVLACVLALPAAAAECGGHVNNTTIKSETIELSPGHTLTTFVAYSFTTSENSANNAVGQCGGVALTTPDGKTHMRGSCARKTRNGDTWSDFWEMQPGATRGTWHLIGGTGAFAGKQWSGWWEPVMADDKTYMGLWGGNCD